MKIKVCGNTDEEQLKQLDALHVDYAGMIFYPQSPRFAAQKLDNARVRKLQLNLCKVGVFVNASEEEIMKQVRDYGLEIVQLHGDETPSFCQRISDQIKVIKAFRINDSETNIDWIISDYREFCDYYLFDKGSAGLYGGTGKKFDWNILVNCKIGKPFFLSGGVAPQDAQAVRNFHHPFFYGVDINSRFEISAGIKDINLITSFLNELKR